MIVDTMTFEDIAQYLWRKLFNLHTLANLNLLYYDRQEKYKKEIRKWNWTPVDKRDEILIFKPLKNKVCDLVLRCVPSYSGSGKFIDFVYFTTFHYRGTKYVAMKLSYEPSVMFYSWHSLRRYAERYLGEPDAEIDDVFISEMLCYNICYEPTEYDYQRKHTNMFVTRDGAFLADIFNDVFVARTFISLKEYFSNQKELDSEAFKRVQKYKADKYGDSFERSDS